MDSILGIGLPELIVVLLLAGLVMGPHRIRQVARTLGRLTAQLQGISREFARQLNAELDSLDDGEMRGSLQELRALQDEVKSLRRELREAPKSVIQEGRSAVGEAQQVFGGAAATQAGANDSTKRSKPAGSGGIGAPEERATALPRLLEVPDDPE